jgi:hypothetical protein
MRLFLQTSSRHQEDSKEGKQIHFLICESCFWCASLLGSNNYDNDNNDAIVGSTTNNNYNIITKHCPSCSNNRVESIPISYDEAYKLDYNPRRGVTLEFSTVHHP